MVLGKLNMKDHEKVTTITRIYCITKIQKGRRKKKKR